MSRRGASASSSSAPSGSGTSSIYHGSSSGSNLEKHLKLPLLAKSTDFQNWRMKFLSVMEIEQSAHLFIQRIEFEDDADPELIANMKRKKLVAKATLYSAVDDSILEVLRMAPSEDPFDLWTTLSNHFVGCNANRLRETRQELFSMKLKDGASLVSYIDRINELSSQLNSGRVGLRDEDKLSVFLNGLSMKYQSIIDILSTVDNLTYGDACQRTLEFHRRRFGSPTDTTDQTTAVSTKFRQKHNGRSKWKESGQHANREHGESKSNDNQDEKPQCYKCKRYGHTANNCRSNNGEKNKVKCFKCDKLGHIAKNCRSGSVVAAGESSKDDYLFTKIHDVFMASVPHGVWVIDSGATSSFTNTLDGVYDVKFGSDLGFVKTADGNRLKITAIGKTNPWGEVRYVPELKLKLLSVGQLRKDLEWTTEFGSSVIIRDKNRNIIAEGQLQESGLYTINLASDSTIDESTNVSSGGDLTPLLKAHYDYGHLGLHGLRELKSQGKLPDVREKELANGLPLCPACEMGKQTRVSAPKERQSPLSETKLELVHIDICGPMSVESGGFRFFAIFVDDATRMVKI
jgi:hypothetical protein